MQREVGVTNAAPLVEDDFCITDLVAHNEKSK
ncbi:hypothetical protein VD0004_g545 [Verticillium dahliae]|nr:hypothetical protein VD0004_g545 [Verticillium dahliae]PNH76857.1 hypothetical protein VD0001_g735 [Verticillium dahliae]